MDRQTDQQAKNITFLAQVINHEGFPCITQQAHIDALYQSAHHLNPIAWAACNKILPLQLKVTKWQFIIF